MEILTAEMLEKRASPCSTGLERFRKAFPEGGEVSAENVRRALDLGLADEVDWFAIGYAAQGHGSPEIVALFRRPPEEREAAYRENAALLARVFRKTIRSGERL